jgi:hypothetical protein
MELGDSLQFTDWERKRKNRGEFTTEFTEDTEKKREQRGCGVTS